MADSRTRLEKYFDVLIAIRKGHHGTEQIVQQTNISPQDVESILESLKSLEFVERVNDLDWRGGEMKAHYRFTVRGDSLMRYLIDHVEILDGRELREFYL